MRHRPGHSLLELALALTISAAIATALASPVNSLRHRVAVEAARRELVAVLATARTAAVVAGGAHFMLDAAASTVWVETAAGVYPGSMQDVGARYGVTLHVDRAAPVALRYDALGVGRLANAHVRIRRGRAEAQLVVSAYGRVRP